MAQATGGGGRRNKGPLTHQAPKTGAHPGDAMLDKVQVEHCPAYML